MVWDFHRSLYGQLSKLEEEAAFQDNLYKNIEPKTAKAIIAATHHLNNAIHKIITLVNHMPMNILRRDDIDKYIMMF